MRSPFPIIAALWLVLLPGHWQSEALGQAAGGGALPLVDAKVADALNEAIELLNAGDQAGARRVIDTLEPQSLSPYERGRVEQILAGIDYAEGNYGAAREHLGMALASGGLSEPEILQLRYQIAQLYIADGNWAEGAETLEQWFAAAPNPNSAAYYLLAIAYYELNDYDRALPAARSAVELTEHPQESWLQLLIALLLQDNDYAGAIAQLERIIELAPDRETYWLQLSSVYSQLDDYPRALATVQLAYSAGLLTEAAEIRRLAELLLFNRIPHRCARVLERGLVDGVLQETSATYDKLADCWLASGELDAAVGALQRGAPLADSGKLFVRLGEVHVRLEQWNEAVAALNAGLEAGGLDDAARAELLTGVALFNGGSPEESRAWFERAASSERYGQTARGYIELLANLDRAQ